MTRLTSMYAGYPAPFAFAEPDGQDPVQQLLFGDWLGVTDERRNGYRFVEKARNSSGWMREEDLLPTRLLEINFVDVGQGDGCFIVTPDDTWILIDAGEGPEMFWYLRWRFNLRNRDFAKPPLTIDHAIITHPDEDHYGGFDDILEATQLEIAALYHNGIIQRPNSKKPLGPTTTGGKPNFLTQITKSETALRQLLAKAENVGRAKYPNLLKKALASKRVHQIRMLAADDGFLPGFDSGDLRIEVLGPVTEKVDGKDLLRVLGQPSITKNGHSIVLKLTYGEVTFALGGDLNKASQTFLLHHHANVEAAALDRVAKPDEYAEALGAARAVFQVDVAKACHHGSSDILDTFLEATNATATVISSGDGEPHSHPRADALGATGKFGRGDRPLIFSTELARSTMPFLDRPEKIRALAADALAEVKDECNRTGRSRKEESDEVAGRFQRAVAVYGLITARTDGTRVVVAQKLEQKRGAKGLPRLWLTVVVGSGGEFAVVE